MPSSPKKPVNRAVILVFTVLALVAVILLSSIPGSGLQSLTSPFSWILVPVQNTVSGALDAVSDRYRSMTDAHEILTENEQLREENAALRRDIKALEENGRRYEALKAAFGLKDDFTDYDIRGANVLTEQLGVWFDVLKIDLGTRDGIAVSETRTYPVLDANSSLVGRVLSSDLVSGKVLLLTAEGFAATARINRVDGGVVRIRGAVSTETGREGTCVVDRIPVGVTLREGDELVTSGLGGVFPPGIPIGTVISVRDASSTLERTAILRPYSDVTLLETVFIMLPAEENAHDDT